MIHDWNRAERPAERAAEPVLVDETLRDGLQSPSLRDPSIGEKIELLHAMASLGVGVANVGLPGAGRGAFASAAACARAIAEARLALIPSCAARTMRRDIEAVSEVSQGAGVGVEVYAFVGCSPVRMLVEGWSTEWLMQRIEESAEVAEAEGLSLCLVLEDATRAAPALLASLLRRAVDLGVRRFCLCDTVGHATPEGAARLVRWTRGEIGPRARGIGLDWHGHNDRGLAVANALAAWSAGCDRIHGTGLGLGERVGNAALDQLVVNFGLMGARRADSSGLAAYCQTVARACGVEVPFNYPVVGRDAFRTATGVHAAAIAKASKLGAHALVDAVYSGVPARDYGQRQVIEVGPMSGASNVEIWLSERTIPSSRGLVEAILERAKASDHVLTDHEIGSVIRAMQPREDASAAEAA
jgi:2-isopropylmalate synthase